MATGADLDRSVRTCGCTFGSGNRHIAMAPDGCRTHGVGNEDTFPRRYIGVGGTDPGSYESHGFLPRPSGLDRVWKPKPGGTL